ncbi:MAG: hypothetical protein M5U34_18915 [Chloroflexi bacterium]|nr:hypothetical protein [Chloroflexota bacterium]
MTGAVAVAAAENLLLLTADGYARRLAAKWVFAPEKPNQKGKSLVARRGDVVGTAVSGSQKPRCGPSPVHIFGGWRRILYLWKSPPKQSAC